MPRVIAVCAVLTMFVPLSRADDPPPTRTVIKLEVEAKAAPKPALRYSLLPELADLNPGNPIQGYMKCFMEQNHFFHQKTVIENREKWQTMPLAELPLKEMGDYKGNVGLRQADYAARLDTPDWQILPKLKTDGVNLLLPDVQQLRMLASALKVRFRMEVAEKRHEDALRTAQTMFSLSRHLGEHPTLIGDLVGMAIAFMAIGPLDELIQQPGCPNLYWALTDLPSPFIDLRKGMQGERVLLAPEFSLFDRRNPLSEADLQKAAARIATLIEITRGPGPKADLKPGEWLRSRANNEAHVTAARKRLIEIGFAEADLKRMPALQVVLLDEKRTYEVWRDEAMKWLNVPWPRAEAGMRGPQKKDIEDALFVEFVPAQYKVRRAQVRLEQRIALLRHVEAVRLYAAEHDGKLPAALADIDVPLPADPYTGKPFHYEVEGKKAILRGSPPKGEEKTAAYNIQYEVTIRK